LNPVTVYIAFIFPGGLESVSRLFAIAAVAAMSCSALSPLSAQRSEPLKVSNVLPPLQYGDDSDSEDTRVATSLPIEVPPFKEHGRLDVVTPTDSTVAAIAIDTEGLCILTNNGRLYRRSADESWTLDSSTNHGSAQIAPQVQLQHKLSDSTSLRSLARLAERLHVDIRGTAARWVASSGGLLQLSIVTDVSVVEDLPIRGVNDVLVDADGTTWVATTQGLFAKTTDADWKQIRGRQGLPVEYTTCLTSDGNGRLWIGTSHGVVLYQPKADGRQWFYRAGQRYLPDNHVIDIAAGSDGRFVWVLTKAGLSAIEVRTTTLQEKAQTIETRINERHRRMGIVGETTFASADNTNEYNIKPGPNDGLWTAYHVAAMSLCYATTGDEAAKKSALRSMESLYMLQNATGIPGLPARSIVPASQEQPSERWILTPDKKHWWYTDTSSDEIDGHYFAFYTFWEHIARHDDALRDRHIQQVQEMTNYIVDNGYKLIDWDGERTRWGFWDPESLNGNPESYLENGLNSLQILSFLKTAAHVTGNTKYQEHYESLITDHGYLNNVLLEKKVFPDQLNHSDDQLAYVAWYPLLQQEQDPQIRNMLQRSVRRHYLIEEPERASFFFFVTATIDPDIVDLHAAIDNLRRLPVDRRNWKVQNSHRDDITFAPRLDRFDRKQLTHVLPADERHFDRWNDNPYLPDDGGDGTVEDNGSAWLLPYWMARHHGFITESTR